MELDEQQLERNLSEADRNASDNVDITDYFHKAFWRDPRNEGLVPMPLQSPYEITDNSFNKTTSSRDPSPKSKPYQATVEDYNSDSDSTLTEPTFTEPEPQNPSMPDSTHKPSTCVSYSNVRRPSKVRFSRNELTPVVVHQPKDEPAANPQRQNSGKRLYRDEKSNADGLNFADVKWDRLFTESWEPTDRLRSVYRGIADYLMSVDVRETTVLRLSQLRAFFVRFPGGDSPNEPLDILGNEDTRIISLFMAATCEYHLVPTTEGGLAREPALTARGFAELMTMFAQTNPDQEMVRLNKILEELPIEVQSQTGEQRERLPRQISRHLFPPKPNKLLRRTLLHPYLPPVAPDADQRRPEPSGHDARYYTWHGTGPDQGSRASAPPRRGHCTIFTYRSSPHETQRLSHWQPSWQPGDRSENHDASKPYAPPCLSSSYSSDSRSPSPKESIPRRRHQDSGGKDDLVSAPPCRRRNSSPPRRNRSSSTPKRHFDITLPKRSTGLWSSLSALAIQPRHAERHVEDSRSERREARRDRGRRRSHEPSPSEDSRSREYVHYAGGRVRRASDAQGIPRSEFGCRMASDGVGR